MRVGFGIMENLEAVTRQNKRVKAAVDIATHRFCNCDWGKASERDKKANKEALETLEGEVVGIYGSPKGDILITMELSQEEPRAKVALIMFENEY